MTNVQGICPTTGKTCTQGGGLGATCKRPKLVVLTGSAPPTAQAIEDLYGELKDTAYATGLNAATILGVLTHDVIREAKEQAGA